MPCSSRPGLSATGCPAPVRGAKRIGTAEDRREATYRQLSHIAYLLGIDKRERNARKMWYRIARDVRLTRTTSSRPSKTPATPTGKHPDETGAT
jgi:hypothetical protein